MQQLAMPLHSVRSNSGNIKGAHTSTYKKAHTHMGTLVRNTKAFIALMSPNKPNQSVKTDGQQKGNVTAINSGYAH